MVLAHTFTGCLFGVYFAKLMLDSLNPLINIYLWTKLQHLHNAEHIEGGPQLPRLKKKRLIQSS